MRAGTLGVICLIAVTVTVGCSASKHEHVVLQAVGATSGDQLDRAAGIVRARLDLLGVKNASIETRGAERLVIKTRSRLSSAQKLLLTKTGSLAFYDLEADLAGLSVDAKGHPVASDDPFDLLRSAGSAAGHPSELFLVDRVGRVLAGPEKSRPALLTMARLRGEVPKVAKVLSVPPHLTLVSCDADIGCPGVRMGQRAKTFYYLFRFYPGRASNPIPEATGADLQLNTIRAMRGTQPAEGQAFVQFGFKSSGNRKFQHLTKELAIRGQTLANAAGEGASNDLNVTVQFAQHFALVLDGRLESTPFIDYRANPDGIDPAGNGAEISNIQSYDEAKDLALVLATGALPFHFAFVR